MDLVFTQLPVANAPITGHFGQTEGYDHPHRGTDFGCVVGTPVRAPADGTVVPMANDGSFGNAVCLDHEGTPWYSLYAHLSVISVQMGAKVKAGDIIGLSGNTGASTGPHLHWQVCRSSQFPTDIAQSTDAMAMYHPEAAPMPEQPATSPGGDFEARISRLEKLMAGNGYARDDQGEIRLTDEEAMAAAAKDGGSVFLALGDLQADVAEIAGDVADITARLNRAGAGAEAAAPR